MAEEIGCSHGGTEPIQSSKLTVDFFEPMKRGEYRQRDRMLTDEYVSRANGPPVAGSRLGRTTGQGQYLEYRFDGRRWHLVLLEKRNTAPPEFAVLR